MAALPLNEPGLRRQDDDVAAVVGDATGSGRQNRYPSPAPETTDVMAHGLDNFSFVLDEPPCGLPVA